MKKILFLASLLLSLLTLWQENAYAQPPQGGRPGGGNRPAMGPPREGMNHGEPDRLMLEHFPDIPDLSLVQRTDIGIILMKEQKEVEKQMQKKRPLLEEIGKPSVSEKNRIKIRKNIEKADMKIKQHTEKSNKKIKKILSEEQYRIFIEKRSEFRFHREPPFPRFNVEGNERPRGDRPEGMRGRPGGRRP